jgi:hypothetical protein
MVFDIHNFYALLSLPNVFIISGFNIIFLALFFNEEDAVAKGLTDCNSLFPLKLL